MLVGPHQREAAGRQGVARLEHAFAVLPAVGITAAPTCDDQRLEVRVPGGKVAQRMGCLRRQRPVREVEAREPPTVPAQAMEQPALATDERYATHGARGQNMAELDELIARWSATVKAEELLERLHDNGVPAGRIFKARDMLADPHFAAREAIVRLAHPELGEFAMHNVVPKLSKSPGRVRHVGPELGEHNDEIYRDLLGLDDDALSSLRAAGVI